MSEAIDIESVLEWPVFSLSQDKKSHVLLSALNNLTAWHDDHCPEYHSVLSKVSNFKRADSLLDLPFLPVRLFKHQKLLSVPQSEVI
jgi:hypothetical protein